MNVLVVAAAVVAALAAAGIALAVVVRIVARRLEVWADAMILSFGLPPIEPDGDDGDRSRRVDAASAKESRASHAARRDPGTDSGRRRRPDPVGACP